jgi:TPR repeat protein
MTNGSGTILTVCSGRPQFFRRHVPGAFGGSAEYRLEDSKLLDRALVLVDRIVIATAARPEFSKLAELSDLLAELIVSESEGRAPESWREAARFLEHHAEHWLKAILWLVNPEEYKKLQQQADEARAANKSARFNLVEVLAQLDLLNKSEANAVDPATIRDPVRRIVWDARSRRNAMHDPGGHPQQSDLQMALILLLAPVFKWRDDIEAALRGLCTRAVTLEGVALQTLRSVSEAWRNHVTRFVAREEWLRDLPTKLRTLQDIGGFLVVTGPEGQGKTALAAKLVHLLAGGTQFLGGDAAPVSREMPWLPGALLHLGKQASRPADVTRLLLAQANSLLLTPIPFSLARGASVTIMPPSVPGAVSSGLRSGSKGEWSSELGDASAQATSLPEVGERLRTEITPESELEECSRHLFWAFERLVDERGSALLVIDALDEISRDGRSLAFLPEPLPRGCAALVTVRSNMGLDRWLKLNRTNVDIVALENLSRAEAPLLTRVPDGQSEEARKFNDLVFENSRGWAYMLAGVGREVEKNAGDFTRVAVMEVGGNLLDRQVTEWFAPDVPALRECLVLLALFEPCSPLSVDSIQGFLLSRGHSHTKRSDVVRLLQKVGPQIEGLASGRVKLAQSVLARYVRQTFLSQRDFNDVCGAVVQWLGSDTHIESDTVVSYLAAVSEPGERRRPDSTETAIVDRITERRDGNLLHELATRLFRASARELAVRCLEAAASLNQLDAMRKLGNRLLDGRGIRRDRAAGTRWLRQAAESGSAVAMLRLGQRVVDGDGMKRDAVEGAQWLRRAIELGECQALVSLGSRLLDGRGLRRDRTEGEQLLREAARRGSPAAMFQLGTRLFDGTGISKNPIEGEGFLRAAFEAGEADALAALGEHLLEGDNSAERRDDGEVCLRQALSAGSSLAQTFLGVRLLNGSGVPRDEVEGERLLRSALEKGSAGAAIVLAYRYFSEKSEKRNAAEGEQLLRAAANLGNVRATLELADRFIAGRDLPRDPEAARGLLSAAAEKGSVLAMRVLGQRLSFGIGIARDVSHGEEWLRRALDRGDGPAARLLARHMFQSGTAEGSSSGEVLLQEAADAGDDYALIELIERKETGRGMARGSSGAVVLLRERAEGGSVPAMEALGRRLVKSDPSEAGRWLRGAAERGSVDAMRALGGAILDGSIQAMSSGEGESWYRRAIDDGDVRAMRIFAERMLDGDGLSVSAQEGASLLAQAMERGDEQSKVRLAERLIDGSGLEAEPLRGRRLLQEAADAGSGNAAVVLGERLLEGKGIDRDETQGIAVLRAAASQGSVRAMAALGSRLVDKGPSTSSEGLALLLEAAECGDEQAMLDLGGRYFDGKGVPPNSALGEQWLVRAERVGVAEAFSALGFHLYSNGRMVEAADALKEGVARQASHAANNLVYMLRRGDIPAELDGRLPDELLADELAENDPFARLNLALCLAQGFRMDIDWMRADAIVRSIGDRAKDLIGWWTTLAEGNDPEGHLVLGWLGRHGLIPDEDQKAFPLRLQAATVRYTIPSWMFSSPS